MEDFEVGQGVKRYIQWPLFLSVCWIPVILLLNSFSGRKAAGIAVLGFILYSALAVVVYILEKRRMVNELFSFAAQYGQVQHRLLREFVLPYALLDMHGNVMWMNDSFSEISGKDKMFHKNIVSAFPEITNAKLPGRTEKTEVTVQKGDHTYRAAMQQIVMYELIGLQDGEQDPEKNSAIAVYLFDITELSGLVAERDKNRIVCGQLSLDNYEEALESVDELRRSLLLALIERKINKYFSDVDGICKKTEKDKYFFMMKKSALDELEAKKFELLEDVKTVNVGNEIAMTISVGIGYGSNYLMQNAEFARSAIELALGRGGDQVVIKEGYNTR